MLRDRLVCGIENGPIQCHLLSEPSLTVDKDLATESADCNASCTCSKEAEFLVGAHKLSSAIIVEELMWPQTVNSKIVNADGMYAVAKKLLNLIGRLQHT